MLLSLEPRGRQSRWMLLASPLLAGLLTLVCGALLFACLGHDPWQTLHTVLVQPLSDLYGLGELLVKAMPILLCALGLALAYQARVWNIGAEGQLLVGALAGSAVAIQLLDWQSRWALAWVLLAGTAAGALWAGFAAWLRTRFNANEILTTIMLNYIALNLLLYGVHGPLKDPDGFNFPQSALFGEASRLPALLAIHRDELRVEVLRSAASSVSRSACSASTAAPPVSSVSARSAWSGSCCCSPARWQAWPASARSPGRSANWCRRSRRATAMRRSPWPSLAVSIRSASSAPAC